MRKWYLGGLILAAALILMSGPYAHKTVAQDPSLRLYLSLDAPALKNLNDIPPDCSNWNELWPNFGAPHHQSGYEDNGDGVVSACDWIRLDGDPWHIIWAGPTYYLLGFPADPDQEPFSVIVEPNLFPHDPANPMGEVWHQIWPVFCAEFPIEGWEDADGSGSITPCDWIVGGDGIMYHVEDIRLNIIAERDPVAIEDSSWNRLKNWFRGLVE